MVIGVGITKPMYMFRRPDIGTDPDRVSLISQVIGNQMPKAKAGQTDGGRNKENDERKLL
jgi:hypothetical protein